MSVALVRTGVKSTGPVMLDALVSVEPHQLADASTASGYVLVTYLPVMPVKLLSRMTTVEPSRPVTFPLSATTTPSVTLLTTLCSMVTLLDSKTRKPAAVPEMVLARNVVAP